MWGLSRHLTLRLIRCLFDAANPVTTVLHWKVRGKTLLLIFDSLNRFLMK